MRTIYRKIAAILFLLVACVLVPFSAVCEAIICFGKDLFKNYRLIYRLAKEVFDW